MMKLWTGAPLNGLFEQFLNLRVGMIQSVEEQERAEPSTSLMDFQPGGAPVLAVGRSKVILAEILC
jgi:hypothetical protein